MACIDQLLLEEMQREDHISIMVENFDEIDSFIDSDEEYINDIEEDDDVNQMIDDVMEGDV